MSEGRTETVAAQAVLQMLDREIWIVTAQDGLRRGGLVATWVSWASIDPDSPQVMLSLAANHFTRELVDSSRRCALHLITAEHVEHVWNFAFGSGRDRDKLDGVSLQAPASNPPILRDCLAWLDCQVFQRLDAGDRIYYWADVLQAECRGDGIPLRQREMFALASDAQRQQLDADRRRDVSALRPLQARWRAASAPVT